MKKYITLSMHCWRHDTKHNDTQHNYIHYDSTQHNDIQHDNKMRHSAYCREMLCCVSFML